MTRPPAPPAPDDLFLHLQAALAGEYSIERELGRGGMGVVYLAREVRLAREVAIKVLPPALAESEAMRAQFLREAQMAARLSHPNIVPIHRVDETSGFVYFVMAYVNGETLAERIRARGPLPPHQAARILREVAWALTYAHSSGIIHRDIKADNILLERGTERALVTDFGIAGAAHADARDTDGRIAGTPHYASPEQIAGEPLEAASDIYSLGVVGFFALTGRLPFDAPTSAEVVAMHLNARAPSITSLAPTVPLGLAQVVDRCLAKRAEHRFGSAAGFAEALDHAIEPPREIPAALRVWLARTHDFQGANLAVGSYVATAITIPLALATGSAVLTTIGAFSFGLSLASLPALIRTRRLLQDGYDIDDLRVAVRQYWVRRREEMVYEWSPAKRGSKALLMTLLGGSAAVTLTCGALIVATGRLYSLVAPLVIAGGFGIVTSALAVARLLRTRMSARAGQRQIEFYDGKGGERWMRIAGVGLKHRAASHSLPQLTEVALGRATDALYDALPKPLRRQLKLLPATVRRLEDDAKTLRAELEKLDASIGTLDGDARGAMPSAIADSSHEARIRADRDRLRMDLRATRDHAAERLSATVAALENIRLNLLRLQLGDGRVESVTASLDAAREVAADVGAFADALTEIEDTLAPPPTSEPSTIP